MNPPPLSTPHATHRKSVLSYLMHLFTGPSATAMPQDATGLSVVRTRLAGERTLMAWIRTGVSLISFGFSIYKFFQIQEVGLKGAFQDGVIGARGFGAIMILVGLVVIGLAGLVHYRENQSMRAAGVEVPPSLAVLVAVLMSLMGILGLIAVSFNQ